MRGPRSWAGLIVTVGIVAIAASSSAQTAPGAAGIVSALQGQVTLERGGRSMPVVHGMAVQEHDRFSTGPGGRLTLTLSDGSQVELGEASSFTIDEDRVDSRGARLATELGLAGGLLRSLVRFAPGNAPNYEVRTPNAIAAARGTDYDVAYSQGQTRQGYHDCRQFTDVTVRAGVVEVTALNNPGAAAVKVKPGRHITVGCGYLGPVASLPIVPLATLGALAAGGGAVAGFGLGSGFGEPQSPMTSSR